jgi:prolipoprotein diacylglyceryltransferase
MKDIKEVAIFICKLVNAIMESLKDGKINVLDATNFIAPLMALGEALGGIGNVITEINAMTEETKKELIIAVNAELNLDETKIEPLISEVLNLALNTYKSYKSIAVLIKK